MKSQALQLFVLFWLTLSIAINQTIADGSQTIQMGTSSRADHAIQVTSDGQHAIEKVASGFEFVEGPLWHPEGFLLFSDIPADRIYQWSRDRGIQVFRQPSGQANGNALDRKGRLITAEHKAHRISRTLDTGEIITLVDRYQNQRLNSPNDLAIKSDGSIYFTDPPYGIKPHEEELGFSGVYRLTAEGRITLLVKDFDRPNGIVLFTRRNQAVCE